MGHGIRTYTCLEGSSETKMADIAEANRRSGELTTGPISRPATLGLARFDRPSQRAAGSIETCQSERRGTRDRPRRKFTTSSVRLCNFRHLRFAGAFQTCIGPDSMSHLAIFVCVRVYPNK